MYALVITSRPPHREALPLAGHEVPSVVAVSNSLISVNCRMALRGCSGTLTKRIILVQDVNVLLALRALNLLQVCSNLIWRKHASHLGNKPRQLSREVGMSGGSIGKIHQLFTDKILEGGREPIACLDRLSRLALLNQTWR
jgi:hypothetical protein